jgi:transposase
MAQSANRYRGWTDAEEGDLRRLYAEGRSILFIAARLRRSGSSVQSRIGRLNLERWDVERASGEQPPAGCC